MFRYIVLRAASTVPVFLWVSAIVFVVMRVAPGDAILAMAGAGEGQNLDPKAYERLREQLGLNRPIVVQYLDWLSGVARLDFGKSFWTGAPVTSEIAARARITVEIAVVALVLTVIIALPIGLVSVIYEKRWWSHMLQLYTILGIALPNFWLGLLVLVALTVIFHSLPPMVFVDFFKNPAQNMLQVIWPASIVAFATSAILARFIRATLREVIEEDYIRTARAKGLPERTVLVVHALKNAIIPTLTYFGIVMTSLLTGAVVVETVFNLPGLGTYLVLGISRRDYASVQAVLLLSTLLVVIVNLLTDILYVWLDPRVRYA